MNLNERFKNFPIKFYKNLKTGNVEYESGFSKGEAKTLNDAFKEFSREDFARDLYYYYDDIVDVEFGVFEPSLNDKIRNGRQYLGKLNLRLDISDYWKVGEPERRADYLNKHRDQIPKQMDFIKKMKREEQIDKLKDKIKNALKKVLNFFTRKDKYEMFEPIKATTELICKHCGKSIHIATYYDTYRNNDYHIECLWDKLVGNNEENSYEASREFFFDLSKYVGSWPAYGYDIEDDYLTDLDLVRTNDRRIKGSFVESIKAYIKILENYEKII